MYIYIVRCIYLHKYTLMINGWVCPLQQPFQKIYGVSPTKQGGVEGGNLN